MWVISFFTFYKDNFKFAGYAALSRPRPNNLSIKVAEHFYSTYIY